MNWLATKSSSPEQAQSPVEERPAAPTPHFVLRRKLVYIHSFSQTALLILALFYTAYFLRDVLVPIVIAFVLYLLLAPVLRALEKLRIPSSLGAALLVLLFFGALAVVGYLLLMPVSEWIGRLPRILDEVVEKVEVLKRPVERVAEASQQVDKITNIGQSGSPTREVILKDGGLLEKLYGNVTAIGAQLVLVIVLLYFLLATGAIFREKLIKAMPTFGDKRRAFTITVEIQKQISRYLLIVTLINIGLGIAVGLTLWFVRMPNPILWGAMATLVNFIPYVGSLIGIGVVAIVALLSFDTLSQALVPPALYLALTSIEGQFVNPSILGRSLTLNPLVIFIAVVIWGFIWGVPGALLAVPFVVILKVVCDNIEPLAAMGEFMSGRTP